MTFGEKKKLCNVSSQIWRVVRDNWNSCDAHGNACRVKLGLKIEEQNCLNFKTQKLQKVPD